MRFTEINEVMGIASRLGQQVASKFGSPEAKGRLETDDMAKHMIAKYREYLGKSGETATTDNLLNWLKSVGYPVTKAEQVINTIPAAPANPAQSTQTTTQTTTPTNTSIPAYQRKGMAAPVTTPKPTLTAQPAVDTNIPAYQRKGMAAPVTTPKPAVAAQPAVNTNIPAYQRKGMAAPVTTPKPAVASTALKFPRRKTITAEAAVGNTLTNKQISDILTAAATEFVSSGYNITAVQQPTQASQQAQVQKPAAQPKQAKKQMPMLTPNVIKAINTYKAMTKAEKAYFASLFKN